jgi:hypothetical protein
MFFKVLLVICGAATCSAVGSVTSGYAVVKGTFTDTNCLTAVSYEFRPLGVCIPNGAAQAYMYTADTTGTLLQTAFTSNNCATGTAGGDGTVTLEPCTCSGGSCTKSNYVVTTQPSISGPVATQQRFDGVTSCGGTPTYQRIVGVNPTSSADNACNQLACSPITGNTIAAASQATCTVPAGTGTITTGYFQSMSYKVRA